MERNEWRGPEELKYPTFDEKYPPLEIGYNNLNETINFGKYEGMIQEIIDIDHSYINFFDDKKACNVTVDGDLYEECSKKSNKLKKQKWNRR